MLTNKQLEKEAINHYGRRNGFSFRGEHSSDYYLFVEKYPKQRIPARKMSKESVLGRNGDLQYEDNSYENVPLPYKCYFHAEDPVPDALSRIAGWLNQPGYWRLNDEYDRNVFRLASFSGPMDVENCLNKYGRCTITFDCKPQRFLVAGEVPMDFPAPSFIVNPTRFTALPLIVVYGTGPGNLTVGNTIVQIKELTDQIILDCEMMNAYRQVGEGAPENKNNTVYAIPYPELRPGENTVTWDGGITSVKITPRWWTL